jgi:hypothetical protein
MPACGPRKHAVVTAMEELLPKCRDRQTENRWRGTRHRKRNNKISLRSHNIMTTPVRTVPSYISDDESDANVAACPQCEQHGWIGTYCSRCEDQGMTHSVPIAVRLADGGQRDSWKMRLAGRLRRLTRVGRAGSELPPVGQACLILHGVEGRDLGQQAVVTAQTKARVRVAYQERNGRRGEKLKHPNSLVLLEDGLEIAQDEQGFVWVQREG